MAKAPSAKQIAARKKFAAMARAAGGKLKKGIKLTARASGSSSSKSSRASGSPRKSSRRSPMAKKKSSGGSRNQNIALGLAVVGLKVGADLVVGRKHPGLVQGLQSGNIAQAGQDFVNNLVAEFTDPQLLAENVTVGVAGWAIHKGAVKFGVNRELAKAKLGVVL